MVPPTRVSRAFSMPCFAGGGADRPRSISACAPAGTWFSLRRFRHPGHGCNTFRRRTRSTQGLAGRRAQPVRDRRAAGPAAIRAVLAGSSPQAQGRRAAAFKARAKAEDHHAAEAVADHRIRTAHCHRRTIARTGRQCLPMAGRRRRSRHAVLRRRSRWASLVLSASCGAQCRGRMRRDRTSRMSGASCSARSSDCRSGDHLVPWMNACISSSVTLPSLLLSIALKIRS